ncbi:WAT1-related protein At5g40240-like [Andrographis paniculata]|uniref:WAT1-related protein At5g40240-like n=1 Tax=Andrographis paniculata TaxID=175694 RepID=UPI0021E87DB6|nr:WAT1-related protein At5g40240-like [Andrographis paniculata]
MPMQGGRYWLWELLVFAAMAAVECTNVGVTTIYKAAVTKGLNYHVYMAYSYAIAAAVLLPLACLNCRNTPLPRFTVVLFGKFFAIGFLGFTGQSLMFLGIAYSSPTLGSAMSNLTPVCSFCLAILFRLEKLKLRSLSSQAKIIGASVSIAGALVIVLYNGPVLISTHDRADLRTSIIVFRRMSELYDWVLGGALLAAANLVSTLWYVVQTIVVKEYPAEFIVVFFFSLLAFCLALPVGIVFEPHLSSWIIPADIRLVSVLFSGIVGTGVGIMVNMWGLHVKGPVYVSLFKPLSIAIAAVAGVIFLGDQLYLGCVVGSIIITVGFYTLLWGKFKEEMTEEPSPPSDHHTTVLSSDGSDDIVAPLIKP